MLASLHELQQTAVANNTIKNLIFPIVFLLISETNVHEIFQITHRQIKMSGRLEKPDILPDVPVDVFDDIRRGRTRSI